MPCARALYKLRGIHSAGNPCAGPPKRRARAPRAQPTRGHAQGPGAPAARCSRAGCYPARGRRGGLSAAAPQLLMRGGARESNREYSPPRGHSRASPLSCLRAPYHTRSLRASFLALLAPICLRRAIHATPPPPRVGEPSPSWHPARPPASPAPHVQRCSPSAAPAPAKRQPGRRQARSRWPPILPVTAVRFSAPARRAVLFPACSGPHRPLRVHTLSAHRLSLLGSGCERVATLILPHTRPPRLPGCQRGAVASAPNHAYHSPSLILPGARRANRRRAPRASR